MASLAIDWIVEQLNISTEPERDTPPFKGKKAAFPLSDASLFYNEVLY